MLAAESGSTLLQLKFQLPDVARSVGSTISGELSLGITDNED